MDSSLKETANRILFVNARSGEQTVFTFVNANEVVSTDIDGEIEVIYLTPEAFNYYRSRMTLDHGRFVK